MSHTRVLRIIYNISNRFQYILPDFEHGKVHVAQHHDVLAVVPLVLVVDGKQHVPFDVTKKRQIPEFSINLHDREIKLALVVKTAGIIARKAEYDALKSCEFCRLVLMVYLL